MHCVWAHRYTIYANALSAECVLYSPIECVLSHVCVAYGPTEDEQKASAKHSAQAHAPAAEAEARLSGWSAARRVSGFEIRVSGLASRAWGLVK